MNALGDQNPYDAPHAPTNMIPMAVSAKRQKDLRRYSRGFLISLAVVAIGLSPAPLATILNPRVPIGEALLALAAFPYYIPITGGLISAVIFAGLWVATWFASGAVHHDVPRRAQTTRPDFLGQPALEEHHRKGRRMTWRQIVCAGAVMVAFVGFLIGFEILESITEGFLRRQPLWLSSSLLLLVALLIWATQRFRSKTVRQDAP